MREIHELRRAIAAQAEGTRFVLGEGAERAALLDLAPAFSQGELEAALLGEETGRWMLTPRLLARAIARRAFESPLTMRRAH